MYAKLLNKYYWPQMVADVATTVRNWRECERNLLELIKSTNPLQLFLARKPFVSVGIDILRPLSRSKIGRRFIKVVTDWFTNLTQVIPLRRVDALSVSGAFA